jgi:hypothetical protein
MTRKAMVSALAIVLVVAVAVPVMAAQDTVLTPRVTQELSKRALAKARMALRSARGADQKAKQARSAATRASRTGIRALAAARNAQVAAGTANAAIEATKVRAGVAAAGATTASESFVALPGGPSVAVTVPPSGLIEVWAQVTMDEAGAVSLFQDGAEMPGQSESCGPPGGGGALLSGEALAIPETPVALATPATPPFCATDGPPSPVLFQTTPGAHTYELRYASCGCGGGETSPVTFSERRLFVATRP